MARYWTIGPYALRTLVNDHTAGHLTGAQADQWARRFGAAMHEFGVNNERRTAKFMATVMHECGGLRWLEELADGSQYENRAALGNVRPGDGRRFKGRGLIQLTGRYNYTAADRHFRGLLNHPERAASPELAARIAGWWWSGHGCNQAAETPGRAGLERVTRIVNGGMNGWADRLRLFNLIVPKVRFFVPRQKGSR